MNKSQRKFLKKNFSECNDTDLITLANLTLFPVPDGSSYDPGANFK